LRRRKMAIYDIIEDFYEKLEKFKGFREGIAIY
jgi:hypothetical protein